MLGSVPKCWLRTARRDKAAHLCPVQMFVPPLSKGRRFLPAGRCCSLLSRILPVATQPCDSHWICAKSVFENARCQKRKSRGRPHDRNRPVETETKRAFLLHRTLCQRSKTTGGREEETWPEDHVLFPPSVEISASP